MKISDAVARARATGALQRCDGCSQYYGKLQEYWACDGPCSYCRLRAEDAAAGSSMECPRCAGVLVHSRDGDMYDRLYGRPPGKSADRINVECSVCGHTGTREARNDE